MNFLPSTHTHTHTQSASGREEDEDSGEEEGEGEGNGEVWDIFQLHHNLDQVYYCKEIQRAFSMCTSLINPYDVILF